MNFSEPPLHPTLYITLTNLFLFCVENVLLLQVQAITRLGSFTLSGGPGCQGRRVVELRDSSRLVLR